MARRNAYAPPLKPSVPKPLGANKDPTYEEPEQEYSDEDKHPPEDSDVEIEEAEEGCVGCGKDMSEMEDDNKFYCSECDEQYCYKCFLKVCAPLSDSTEDLETGDYFCVSCLNELRRKRKKYKS